MQFGFILLVLAVLLQLASIDADATVRSPAGPVGVASVDGKATRFLRASPTADDDEERADATAADKIVGFFTRMFGSGKKLQATSKVDEAAESLRADAAELVKLTKSVPDSADEYAGYYSTLEKTTESFIHKVNRYFDKDRKATPDNLISEYKLDPELALKMKNTKSLKVLKDADPAPYVMWFEYSKYYKNKHPNWKTIYDLAKLTRF